MKLSIQCSGLCASGAFIITALPSFFQQLQPTSIASISANLSSGITMIETLLFSLGGAVVAGFIGFHMGRILSEPKGTPKKETPQKLPQQPVSDATEPIIVDEAALNHNLESYTTEPESPTETEPLQPVNATAAAPSPEEI